MRFTDRQRAALIHGTGEWTGAKETGILGSTMIALRDRGLAEVSTTRRPHRRMVYRLTEDGLRARAGLLLDGYGLPPPGERITVQCPHCGWLGCGVYVVGARCTSCETGFVYEVVEERRAGW